MIHSLVARHSLLRNFSFSHCLVSWVGDPPRPGSALFNNKKQINEAQLLVYLKSFLLISMVELNNQRSAAKILVTKIGLYTCVLFNIFNYCRFASYSEFAFEY